MIKVILFLCLIVCLGILSLYIFLAIQSQKTPDVLGPKDGQLLPCPDSPNCVCSESHTHGDKQHYIDPLSATLEEVKAVILQQGGKIRTEHDNYIHATFTSAIFRYVDDIELRQEPKSKIVHMRSASRTGKSDLGVNRKRMEAIRQAL